DFDITFHRAFDELTDQIAAYKILTQYKNIKRILTSGGQPTAQAGKENLKQLVDLSKQIKGPKILVGSGVSIDNLEALHAYIQAEEYHIGSAARLDNSFDKGLDRVNIEQAQNMII